MSSFQMQGPVNGAASSGSRTLPLLKFPQEILICIAGQLDSGSDLCSLARVNKRLRSAAQTALYGEVSLRKNTILKLLPLLSRRPDLAAKIQALDFGSYKWSPEHCAEHQLMGRMHYHRIGLVQSIGAAIDSCNSPGFYWSILTEWDRYQFSWLTKWNLFPSLMIAISPNLKRVEIELPRSHTDDDPIPDDVDDDDIVIKGVMYPFSGPANQLLEQRLQELTLRSSVNTSHNAFVMRNVTLRNLANLTRLTLPMEALFYKSRIPLGTSRIFPRSLRVLQIQPCNKHLINWTMTFSNAFMDGHFPNFKRLVFSFEHPCVRDALLLINQEHINDINQEYINDLEFLQDELCDLAEEGLEFEATDCKGMQMKDFFEELRAWTYLSDFERWWTATYGLKFSEVYIATTRERYPCYRTIAERRAFRQRPYLKQARRLRGQSNFVPKIPLNNSPSATFGTDQTPEVNLQSCAFNMHEWSLVLSSLVPSSDAATMEVSTALHRDKKRQRIRWYTPPPLPLSTDLPSLGISFQPPPTPTMAGKFEADEWLGQTFFPKGTKDTRHMKLDDTKLGCEKYSCQKRYKRPNEGQTPPRVQRTPTNPSAQVRNNLEAQKQYDEEKYDELVHKRGKMMVKRVANKWMEKRETERKGAMGRATHWTTLRRMPITA